MQDYSQRQHNNASRILATIVASCLIASGIAMAGVSWNWWNPCLTDAAECFRRQSHPSKPEASAWPGFSPLTTAALVLAATAAAIAVVLAVALRRWVHALLLTPMLAYWAMIAMDNAPVALGMVLLTALAMAWAALLAWTRAMNVGNTLSGYSLLALAAAVLLGNPYVDLVVLNVFAQSHDAPPWSGMITAGVQLIAGLILLGAMARPANAYGKKHR